jgi:hypothetical protein
MGKFGIKISRPSYNVSASDIADANLIMSTNFPTFKLYRVMELAPASKTEHGLTYPPVFFYMVETDTDKWQQHTANFYDPFTYVAVDSTYVYVSDNYFAPDTNTYVFLFTDALNE